MPAQALDFMYSSQASAEHFKQCAEFLLLRNRGLGPIAATVLPIPLARRGAAAAKATEAAAPPPRPPKLPRRRWCSPRRKRLGIPHSVTSMSVERTTRRGPPYWSQLPLFGTGRSLQPKKARAFLLSAQRKIRYAIDQQQPRSQGA